MDNGRLNEIEACVFDAYGTLFDVITPFERRQDKLGDKAGMLAQLWRQKQLEYTWLRSLMGRHVDFWQVTGDALDYAMDACGIDDPPVRAALMEMYLTLEPYPEVADTLTQIQAASLKTAILSNGSPMMLSSVTNKTGLSKQLDAVLSVEEREIFKPHPSVYQIAVDQLRITAAQVCFLSSNSWDIHGAATFGFQAVWINRGSQHPDRLPSGPRAEIRTLDELLPLLGL
jgi:2-haloacid dehalogenase